MKVGNSHNTALHQIGLHKQKTEKQLENIADGKKLEISDAAMMQIAQALLSDANVISQGVQNANESVAMLQIADGVLQNVSQMATRLEEINVRASSPSLNTDQKKMLQSEYNAQTKAINDALKSASYNSQPLFGKSFTTSIGKGEISVDIPNLDTSKLSFGDNDALKAFREALSDAVSSVGAGINGFASATNNLFVARVNTLAAYSQIADTDIAQSVNSMKNEDLLTQSALFAQAHKNTLDRERVHTLLA